MADAHRHGGLGISITAEPRPAFRPRSGDSCVGSRHLVALRRRHRDRRARRRPSLHDHGELTLADHLRRPRLPEVTSEETNAQPRLSSAWLLVRATRLPFLTATL